MCGLVKDSGCLPLKSYEAPTLGIPTHVMTRVPTKLTLKLK